jgi:drug/metabolite transporter (DMT)-like permease
VIAFRSRNEGVRLAGPNQAMAFYNMLFVYGTLLGVLFLGETLTWSNLLGGISVIGGGLLSALGDQSRKHAQEKTVT